MILPPRLIGILVMLLMVVGMLVQNAGAHLAAAATPGDAGCSNGVFRPPFENVALALEFAEVDCQIAMILGDRMHSNRARIWRSLTWDAALIIGYWCVFTTSALSLMRGRSQWQTWVALTAVASVTIAAVFDSTENRRIEHVLVLSLDEITPNVLRAVREAALLKWASFFMTTGLLGVLILQPRPRTTRPQRFALVVCGASFAIATLVGFVGLAHPLVLRQAVELLFPGFVGLIFLSWVWPDTFTPSA